MNNNRTVGGKIFIKTLTKYLNQGDPVSILLQIVFNDDPKHGGGHAVNATKLIQDGANPNRYYLEVYDNNLPGETMVIDLDCSKNSCEPVNYRNTNVNGIAPKYHIAWHSISMTFAPDRIIVLSL